MAQYIDHIMKKGHQDELHVYNEENRLLLSKNFDALD